MNNLLKQFFRKNISFALQNYTNLVFLKKPKTLTVYQKNIDFLKNCRLKSHKNALKRRSVQNYNRTKQFFQ